MNKINIKLEFHVNILNSLHIPEELETIAFYITTQKEYYSVTEYLRRKERTSCIANYFCGEDWYLFEYFDGGDFAPSYDVYKLCDIVDDWGNFIIQFRE